MGVFFAIFSPAIFSISSYIDKFLLEKHDISPTVITVYGGIFAFIAGLVMFFITGFYPIDLKSLLIILSSGFLTNIYLLPYYKALSADETSRIIPLFQFYPIFVLILSFILLKEGFSTAQYVGSALIVGSGFLLSVEKLEGKIFKLRKSFFYMMISCFIFAVAQVLYKFGVTEIPFWNTLPYEGFGIALGALSIVLYKNNFSKFKKETTKFKKRVFIFLTINELVYIVGRYTGYFAISLISVGLVSILAGLQPLFTLIYGIILSIWFPHIIKEVITKKTLGLKFTAIVIIIVGSYFIFA
jgi:drug/metabolite transporter (DMT)-like permease